LTSSSESILVTGASSGIGQAIATKLASDGYEIAVHYSSNRSGAEETVSQIKETGGSCRLISFNQRDNKETASAIDEDIAVNGAYYGVVCNAGITSDAAFPMMSADDWHNVIDINLNGLYNVLHPIIMPMVRRRKPGRIVTLSSVSGITGNRGQANYSASKAGIIGASKSLAVELAKRNITVNCVAPGLIDTGMTAGFQAEQIREMVPARRAGTAEEVAALVAFLCSPDAGYITRQVISINGGMI